MWLRDEFLVHDRLAERERGIHEAARIRGLIGGELLPPVGLGPEGRLVRRMLARLLVASASGAMTVARWMDAEVYLEMDRRRHAHRTGSLARRGPTG